MCARYSEGHVVDCGVVQNPSEERKEGHGKGEVRGE